MVRSRYVMVISVSLESLCDGYIRMYLFIASGKRKMDELKDVTQYVSYQWY